MPKKKGASVSPFVPAEEQPYPIPENWCWTYLTGFAECLDSFRKPINATERAGRSGSIPYYGATGQVGWIDDFLTDEQLVLVGEDGAPFLDRMKDKAYMIEGKAWVNNHAHILRSYFGSAGNFYLFNYLNCFDYSGYVNGTTRLKLTQASMNTIPIPVAPLPEQHRIVSRIESLFAKLDEAKEKAQAVVDGFELRKSAILHKAFTGELTEQWRKEHGGHLSDWTNTTLSEIVSGFKYGTSEKSTYNNTGMPVLRIPNVGDGILKFEDMKYLAHNDVDEANQVHENDLLIIRSNGSRDLVGKCAIVPALSREFSYASFLIRIKPSEQILPDYLALYLNSTDARAQMFKKAKSSAGIHNINSQELGSITINVPTVYEQSAIIAVLDSLLSKEQQAKETAEAVLVQIDTMKKAILARAFRGELGTNDPNEESSAKLVSDIESRRDTWGKS